MARIGRNDPCPCGSGKKYKHCCYSKQAPAFPQQNAWRQDPEWLKIRQTEGEVVHRILDFATKKYGRDLLKEALAEFGIWGEYEVDDKHLETIFIPWVAFNWTHETVEN